MPSELKRIRSITIVGGGSSGWMAAAYLSKVFHDVSVTLIESKKIPAIGVGEATVPTLAFHEAAGIRRSQRLVESL
jgi:tryptophan 7-halogenase